MHHLLLFNQNEQPIAINALERAFQSAAGFGNVRRNTPTGTPIEADFSAGPDFTTVRLNRTRQAISIDGTSDASIRAALTLQEHLPSPMRMVDTEYSFDLALQGYPNIEALRNAIAKAQGLH